MQWCWWWSEWYLTFLHFFQSAQLHWAVGVVVAVMCRSWHHPALLAGLQQQLYQQLLWSVFCVALWPLHSRADAADVADVDLHSPYVNPVGGWCCCAGVTTAASGKLKANEWVNVALEVLGGKGGGKALLAQGQGSEVAKAAEALKAAEEFAALKL
jgi:hypothetical protein